MKPMRRRTSRGISMLLAVTLFAAQGCASWHPLTPKTDPDDVAGSMVRGSYRGEPFEVRAVEMSGHLLQAKVRDVDGRWRDVVFDLRRIDHPEALYRNTSQKISMGMGIGIGSAVGVALLSMLVAGVLALANSGISTGAGMR